MLSDGMGVFSSSDFQGSFINNKETFSHSVMFNIIFGSNKTVIEQNTIHKYEV